VILAFLAGFLVSSGLWLEDELLTEVMYSSCGSSCLYPVPLLGSWSIYAAEGLSWLMVLAGVALFMIGKTERGSATPPRASPPSEPRR
jgi:hypothetical protein